MHIAAHRQFVAVALAVAAIALSVESAAACGCVDTPVCAFADGMDGVRAADAVFVGRVLAHSSIETRFRIERMVVGKQAQELTLGPLAGFAGKTGKTISSCDMPFTVGERYLVYAFRHSETGDLVTSRCSRTQLISSPRAAADLAFFDARAQRQSTAGWVSGIVEDGDYDTGEWVGRRLAGVRVVATRPVAERKVAYTNADGVYVFSGLSPAWRITAELPPPYLPHDGAIGRRDGSETPGVDWRPGLSCAEADIHALRRPR